MRNLAENNTTTPSLPDHVIIKLSQLFLMLRENLSTGKDSNITASSPQDVLNSVSMKIKEWLRNLVHKLDELLPPETREEKIDDWLTVALNWVRVALPYLIIILCLRYILKCCCPCLKGFWRGGRVGKLMKAPGRAGVVIPRNAFEVNPRSYFLDLRSRKSIKVF